MLSSVDVHNFLQDLDIPHELFKLAGQAGTLERAAAALGLELSQLVRVDFFHIDGEPVMVIIPSDREVDREKLKQVAGGEEVDELSREEAQKLTGFLANCLPPIAHQRELPAYIDYYMLKEDVVYTWSGEPTAILKIRSYDLVRATGGETVDVALEVDDH